MKATSIPALQKAAQKRKSSLSGLLDGVEKQLKQLQHIRDALKEGRMKTAPPVEHLVTLIVIVVLPFPELLAGSRKIKSLHTGGRVCKT